MTDKKEDKVQSTRKAEAPLNSLGYGYDSTLANGPFERDELHYEDPVRNYDYKWCGACAFYEAGYCRALEENIELLASCDAYLSMSEELSRRWEQFYKRVNRLEREESELRNKEVPTDTEVVSEEHKFIEKRDGKYCVFSHQTGKNFGCYKTKAEAEKRLAQIKTFKEAKFEVKFASIDEDLQIVYGIALEPNETDSHGDTITEAEIEKAAHGYALTPMIVGEGHTKKAKATPVETYIAPVEFELGGQTVKKGSWVMAIKVHSKKLWKGVKDGSFTGLSIGAIVRSKPYEEKEEENK